MWLPGAVFVVLFRPGTLARQLDKFRPLFGR
jgi:hypothetical protein